MKKYIVLISTFLIGISCQGDKSYKLNFFESENQMPVVIENLYNQNEEMLEQSLDSLYNYAKTQHDSELIEKILSDFSLIEEKIWGKGVMDLLCLISTLENLPLHVADTTPIQNFKKFYDVKEYQEIISQTDENSLDYFSELYLTCIEDYMGQLFPNFRNSMASLQYMKIEEKVDYNKFCFGEYVLIYSLLRTEGKLWKLKALIWFFENEYDPSKSYNLGNFDLNNYDIKRKIKC